LREGSVEQFGPFHINNKNVGISGKPFTSLLAEIAKCGLALGVDELCGLAD